MTPSDQERLKHSDPDTGGMMSGEDYEVIAQEQAVVDAAAEERRKTERFPTVEEKRLLEMKQRHRAMIEERLAQRRKQRRLMRGGSLK